MTSVYGSDQVLDFDPRIFFFSVLLNYWPLTLNCEDHNTGCLKDKLPNIQDADLASLYCLLILFWSLGHNVFRRRGGELALSKSACNLMVKATTSEARTVPLNFVRLRRCPAQEPYASWESALASKL